MDGVSAFASYSKKMYKLSKTKKTKSDLTNGSKLSRKTKKNKLKKKIRDLSKKKKPKKIDNRNKDTTNSTDSISSSSSKRIHQSEDAEQSPTHASTSTTVSPEAILKSSSIDEGIKKFNWLIHPIRKENFFEKFWEKKYCFIKRNDAEYFKTLISFQMIDEMLIQNHIEFTKNIDVTSYRKGVRETHNPDGRALPPEVWSFYSEGCSIRMLNPQTYLQEIFKMNATLQEMFHCMVGANFYLTPPNSQGFAPHFDDIEAFVLQIEGKKRWKLYESRTNDEILPRISSKNFKQKEIGKPIFDDVLEPGDILYFPRGVIHQACTEPGYHSLHITLSVYQKQSFADFFEVLLPMSLSKAISKNVKLRKGIPLNFWQHVGIAHCEDNTEEREDMLKKCGRLVIDCINELPIDEAADQMAKRFQHDALPPVLNDIEKNHCMFGRKTLLNKNGEVQSQYEIRLDTDIKLLRANIIRLVREEGEVRIYYYIDNSREYQEYEPNFIEIDTEEAIAVEMLIHGYPGYVSVQNLPLDSDIKKITIAQTLWDRGLIMTKNSTG